MREERLAEKALQGDADALEQLVQEQYPEILKYCRWHLPDEQTAQDAAQDTFLKAVRYLDACGSFQGAFRPFLYRIAHNVCIDHLRGVRQDTVSLEALTEPPAYDEAGFTLTEEELALRTLTAKLEPQQRELVLLRFAQQLKLREISKITGLPVRTVQSRLRAALKTLRMELEGGNFHDR